VGPEPLRAILIANGREGLGLRRRAFWMARSTRGCFCGLAPGIVVVGDCVPGFFSCFYPVAGVTLWPFIFVAADVPAERMQVMINHERIHICQANEMLVVFFYLLWVCEFLCGMCKYGSAEAAYLRISLECEAHANEKDLEYCRKRPLWGWTRYTACSGYPGLVFDDEAPGDVEVPAPAAMDEAANAP
jgi:hypothetical protein